MARRSSRSGELPHQDSSISQRSPSSDRRTGGSVRRAVDCPLRTIRTARAKSLPPARAALSRSSVPRLQSGNRRRARFSFRPDARRRGSAARSRHEGVGSHPLEPRWRRAADAEGRGARDTRHRNARSARRRYLEDFLGNRDRRAIDSRRRTQSDTLGGACAIEPRPCTDRQLPAVAGARGTRSYGSAGRLLPRPVPGPASARRCARPRSSRSPFDASGGRTSGRPCRELDGRGLRPRRSQHRQYERFGGKLRLRSMAFSAAMGSGLHRRLFRPCRALCLRPSTRGAALELRAVRRGAAAARRGPTARRRLGAISDRSIRRRSGGDGAGAWVSQARGWR